MVDKTGGENEDPSRLLVFVRSLATGFLLGGASGTVALLALMLTVTPLGVADALLSAILISFLFGAGVGLAGGFAFGLALAVWLTFDSPTVARARWVLSLMALAAIALLSLLGQLDAFVGLLSTPLALGSIWIGTGLVLKPAR